MLENTKMNCTHFNTSGVSCDKKFCNLDNYISKDKVREIINNKLKGLRHLGYIENLLECEFIKLRDELLKEE